MLQAPAIQLPKENISVFTQRARKHYLFFMCVLNVFNFTNVKLHLLQRNCSWLPQYSCNIKLFCFMSLAPLIQLPQTEKSENLIKTEFLRDSASSFHLAEYLYLQLLVRLFVPHRWHLLSSPLYDVSEHANHIFSVRIWSWQHVSVNISSGAELSPVHCCLVFGHFWFWVIFDWGSFLILGNFWLRVIFDFG